jgi:hypothetical protein
MLTFCSCQGDDECDRMGLINRHNLPDYDMEQAEREERGRIAERKLREYQRQLREIPIERDSDDDLIAELDAQCQREEYLQLALMKGLPSGHRPLASDFNNHRTISRAARSCESTQPGLQLALPPPRPTRELATAPPRQLTGPPPNRGSSTAQQRQQLTALPPTRGFDTAQKPPTRGFGTAQQGQQVTGPPPNRVFNTAAQFDQPVTFRRPPPRFRRDPPDPRNDRFKDGLPNSYRMHF